MPTQTEFLNNPGLVPQNIGADCSICHDEATNPVMTSSCECRVVYCQQCILAWFQYGRKCPTCRLQYYTDDRNEVSGPPTFGINATVRNFASNGEGEEVVYLLDLDEMGDLDTPENEQEQLQQIHDFRGFDDDYNPENESSAREVWVDGYLLIDFLLADANTFHDEQLEGALEGSEEADENDFALLIRAVGEGILDLHEQDMTFEECHEQLLQEVLGDLRHESPTFQELHHLIEAQGEMVDLNPLQRYLLYIVEQVAEEAGRVFNFLELDSDDDENTQQDQNQDVTPQLEDDYPPPYHTFGLPVNVREVATDHLRQNRHIYLLRSTDREHRRDRVAAGNVSEIRDFDEEDDEGKAHMPSNPTATGERLALLDAPPLIDALLVHANTFLREQPDRADGEIHEGIHAVVQSLGTAIISLNRRSAITPDEARHELIDRTVNELRFVSPTFGEMYQAHQEQRQLDNPNVVQQYMLDLIKHMVREAERVYMYHQKDLEEYDYWETYR
ncbi:hypothetical protein CKM354_001271400 [Cercospora kikuchii]|uniref:RING-type domain-containing protein n=1 Tax=Cercospora kikuchii TaxID=84275 RepID=A0A9P3FMH5_9PEZI|nr:uncharacterized protein CKM354_001271400 [Cercospora kikuchii]GIZ49687.1 hypothetical protein CKM354_001271400 [Cercospora kikuchii]